MKKAFAIITLAVISTVGVLFYTDSYLDSPSGRLKDDIVVEVPPGSSFYSTAKKLEDKGVIDSVRKFYIYAKLKGTLSDIKAGEYLFKATTTPREAMDQLVRGSVISYRVTIPEGYNIYQISEILASKGLSERKEFIRKSFDQDLMKKLNIKGLSLEGYLYPETYFFTKGISAEEMITEMVERFKIVITDDVRKRAQELGFTLEEIVNLASIIEKETGDPDERPLISAVFHNRLRRGMRLQTDPTVIYGIAEGFDGNLTKRDLETKTPYNTYRINGLPAGPIANPGIESIKAALYPEDVDYLYFVSMNNGSHVFSKTLKEHNGNVWKYQLRRRSKKNAGGK